MTMVQIVMRHYVVEVYNRLSFNSLVISSMGLDTSLKYGIE